MESRRSLAKNPKKVFYKHHWYEQDYDSELYIIPVPPAADGVAHAKETEEKIVYSI